MIFVRVVLFIFLLCAILFQHLSLEAFTSLNTIYAQNADPSKDYTVDVNKTGMVREAVFDPSGNLGVGDIVKNKEFPFMDFSQANKYSPDNYDITYHELNPSGDFYDSKLSTTRVFDQSKNSFVDIPHSPAQNFPVYYDIQKHPHGIDKVTPTYRESVMMETARQALLK